MLCANGCFVFLIFVPRFDIEKCKDCECDHLLVVRSSSYSNLAFYTGECARLSDNHLEYRRLLGNPKESHQTATRIYIRFVSDGTVHRKGFNFSFVAQSYTGKFIEWILSGTVPITKRRIKHCSLLKYLFPFDAFLLPLYWFSTTTWSAKKQSANTSLLMRIVNLR